MLRHSRHDLGRILLICIGGALLAVTVAWAQEFPMANEQELSSEGWSGFTDLGFLWNSVLSLSLATLLGAIIAYHPKTKKKMDTIEEIEAPKIYVMYAIVGAVIGTMVLKYGLVVGLVVFGIGGLIRFRTNLGSATTTGRVIFVTINGLCCGLSLPHVAVLATAFGFVVIYLLDAQIIYRIVVKGMQREHVAAAAESYRRILERQGCHLLHEKKNFRKAQVEFVFRASNHVDRDALEHLFDTEVPEEARGVVDWQID